MGLKRLVKKVTRPIGKAVKKIVPKELAGIMQVAAPLAGPYAPLVYAAGAYKQSGRINPIALATMALPYVGVSQGAAGAQAGSFGIGNLRYGRFDPSILGTADGIKTARDFLGLRGATGIRGQAERFLFGRPGVEGGTVFDTEGIPEGTFEGVKPTQGILGTGGDFDIAGGKLLSKKDGTLSPTKVATAVTMGLSLSQTKEKIEDEGQDLGLSSGEIARLQAEAEEMWEDFDTTAFRPNVAKVAKGGLIRTNLAMGSKPTAQESGLGGLPIEADMRYTGGFMPYGAKEKADDVPARLSKNEFVFTADAVRAAGGGDINMGARRMYNTMKQLESMGRA